ncbi:MAG: hypothetical protein SV377_04275 [Halobacteria archaeon]|nr:hypothetical protein [Halobacteria archaeon]
MSPESRKVETIPTLESVINSLREAGARRIRVSADAVKEGVILLEVNAIYGHWGTEERIKTVLDTAGKKVRWESREWDFRPVLGKSDSTHEFVTVYDRETEREGNGTTGGMSIKDLLDAYY